jgi:PKD repeat protein
VSLTVSNSRGADTKTNPVLITVSPQTASVMIPNVPDNSQPPSQTLASTLVGNFSAPLAAANITEYWDCVIKSSNAVYVNAALPGPTAAEYIGHFMDTNNAGSADRGNDSDNHKGTYAKDIRPALFEYIRWDSRHPYDAPPRLPPPLPEQKKGYRWELDTDYTSGWDLYKAHIDAAGPPLLVFRYWNLGATGITLVNVETAEEIVIFLWGGPVAKSTDGTPGSPGEQWNLLAGEAAIGHAVTGVGYIENWDPDGPGTMPAANYAIVHDNWGVTPKNVAIPWQNRIALVTVRVPACKVWFEDLVSFAADWLKTGTGLAGDLNGNKVVDFSDYGALASLWLDCCPDDWPLR